MLLGLLHGLFVKFKQILTAKADRTSFAELLQDPCRIPRKEIREQSMLTVLKFLKAGVCSG